MCRYFKENGKVPCCTHDCNGCVWNDPVQCMDCIYRREATVLTNTRKFVYKCALDDTIHDAEWRCENGECE